MLKCPDCGHKLGFKKKKRSIIHRLAVSLLWLAFPIYLIGMVATMRMDAVAAILLVIFYHFIAMHVLILFKNYTFIKK